MQAAVALAMKLAQTGSGGDLEGGDISRIYHLLAVSSGALGQRAFGDYVPCGQCRLRWAKLLWCAGFR